MHTRSGPGTRSINDVASARVCRAFRAPGSQERLQIDALARQAPPTLLLRPQKQSCLLQLRLLRPWHTKQLQVVRALTGLATHEQAEGAAGLKNRAE